MANDWMAQGNCADKPPALFFPSDGVGVEVAKRLCVTCAVRPECLEYALHNRIDHGVWGGTSERERRRILKSRRLQIGADLDVHLETHLETKIDPHLGTEVDAGVALDNSSSTGELFFPRA
jgi:WhiB family redox-sensing transcriptional regulator